MTYTYLVYVGQDRSLVYSTETYANTCRVTDEYIDRGCRVTVCEVSPSGRQRIIFDAVNGIS